MNQVLLAILPVLLVFAALSDLLTMRIPNWLVLAIAAGFLLLASYTQIPLPQIGMHLVVALAVLVAAFGMFAMGWMGGGDAKLAAATMLWLGLPLLFNYLAYAALIGGLLTLLVLIFRAIKFSEKLKSIGWFGRLHDKKSGIPYGIALAAAGILSYPSSPVFLQISI